jgi:hypothetical protein
MRALTLMVSVLALPVLASDVDPDTAAQVGRDRQKALDEVAKKYGNKKSSELSGDERRARVKDEAEAVSRVLDKHGVSAKDMARYEAKSSPAERNARAAELEKKDADKRAADAPKPQDQGGNTTVENGVIIERGTKAEDAERAAASTTPRRSARTAR